MTFRLMLLILIMVFLGCKTDPKTSEVDFSEGQVDNYVEVNKETEKNEALSRSVATKEVKKKKKQAEIKEVEAIEKSEFKDEPCKAIIKKYHQAIELLSKDMKSVEGRYLYKSLRNDPVVRDCRIDNEFKSKFKELDEKYHGLKK